MQTNQGSVWNLPALNSKQSQLASCPEGAILAIAGPGAGKTRVLTTRVAGLIKSGVNSENILALTFTKAAAAEMASRLRELVPSEYELPLVTNFHSLGYQLLCEYYKLRRLILMDPEKIRKKIKALMLGNGPELDDSTVERVAMRISFLKNMGFNSLSAQQHAMLPRPSAIDQLALEAWELYEGWLAEKGAGVLDFDDLINRLSQVLATDDEFRSKLHCRFQHILVDEFQDTNRPQWKLVRQIAENSANPAKAVQTDFSWTNRSLFCCGDDDQAIYGFRGAASENILNFSETYPQNLIVELGENYRSSAEIVNAGQHLIRHNKKRAEKSLFSTRTSGIAVGLYETPASDGGLHDAIGQLVPFLWDGEKSVAVLARHHDQLHKVRASLDKLGIPHVSNGGIPLSKTSEYQAFKLLTTAARKLSDNGNLQPVIREFLGGKTLAALLAKSRRLQMSLWELLVNDFTNDELTIALGKMNSFYRSRIYSAMTETAIEFIGWVSKLTTEDSFESSEHLTRVINLWELSKQMDGSLDIFADVKSWERLEEKAQSPHVELLTLHSSKGLEFDRVVLLDLELEADLSQEEIEEERRLFYVGMTRAIERLAIIYRKAQPSLFVNELAGAETVIQIG